MLGLLRRCVAGGAAALCLALVAAPAQAAISPPIFQIGKFGVGAGEFRFEGGGIAADPETGHLFVSDRLNNRISEFTAWGEFVKAWGWGVGDGSSEAQTCGPVLPTLEPEESLCQVGIAGAEAGQLRAPHGIALGLSGELFVFERENYRVQVFDQDGSFVRMFGGEVNKDTGADVCTAADIVAGDECGIGVEGTGPGEFSIDFIPRTNRDYVDIAADGTVYVGDRNRIQKFDEDGNYLGEISFTGNGEVGELPEPGSVGALALDPESGDIYFSYGWIFDPANSYRLEDSTGAVIYPLPATAPEAIATAPGGTVFLSDDPEPGGNTQPYNNPHLLELNDLGEAVDSCCASTSKAGEGITLPTATTSVVTPGGESALYVAHDDFFHQVGFINVRGPAPEKFLPPPSVAPEVESQQATAVGETGASLRAQINPNFWADTSYHLEYGTAPCPGACTSTPEEVLGAGIVKKGVQTDPIELTGLEAGTTYHYRFVAESGGGGPVAGADRTFTTLAEEGDQLDCANEAFRGGAGARLADCRAYEMVSPVDKLGGEILVQNNQQGHLARLNQAIPSGEEIAYSSYRSFGEAQGAPYQSQYIAKREATSWSTQNISPPQQNGVFNGTRIDSNYRAFSEDLATAWLVQDADPVLAAGGVPDYPNLYRREGLSGSYEALSTVKPPTTGASSYVIEMQGASADGSRTVFRANGKLTATSTAGPSNYQVYEAFKGNLRLVSVKPDGSAATASSSVGSVGSFKNNREANVANAVSEDGTRIYWGEVGGASRLYVRVNAVKTTAVSTGAASFWAARPDGSQAIYSEGGALKRFTLVGESSETLVASGVTGVLGASEDLTRIYVVSTAALAGAAKAGEPNLYLHEDGQPLRFVATLSGSDFAPTEPSPAAVSPQVHLAHVSADGAVAVFMSRASLTGADNVDQESGEADAEVFRYEAAGDELRCISCSPTGQAPLGRSLKGPYWYASRIPTWEFQLHEVRVIAADGDRVYFNSLNRLLAADTNGREDVYQWEAPGSGTCDDEAPGYNADAGGCVTLISSGTDGRDSEFVDASADGRDVFFLTGESLLGWDPGQVDLYDAREDGGLPAPPAVRDPECEGEACQPQGAAPPAPTPNVSESAGPGNPRFKPPCRKGFVRRHGKCVKKPHKNSKGKNSKGKNKPAKHKSRGAGR